MPRNELLLKGDVALTKWGYHNSDGHSYRLYRSQGHLLLMAAPTNIDDTPDEHCAFWMGVEHLADDEHFNTFSDEIAHILQVKPNDIKEALK